jgi:uncharacterized Zn finger protein
LDAGFDSAYAAARHGWDGPALQRVLRGEEDAPDEWEEDAPRDIGLMTRARLRVLARQGRNDAYLNLARAAGQTVAYTTMLARLGRGAEAEVYGRECLATPGEALELAMALAAAGEHERAMGIADHGLTLETALSGGDGMHMAGIGGYAAGGAMARLAAWLRDEALAHGQHERAPRAAERAFREDMSLAPYLRAEEVAGERWADVRPGLIDHLRTVKSATDQGRIDVFPHEGMVEDAIAVIHEYTFPELAARVADAALAARVRAEWVITTARQRAEPIMDEGRAGHYDDAARWLGRARDAYRHSDRDGEWRAYRDDLLAKHGRKYKLVPMIKALG